MDSIRLAVDALLENIERGTAPSTALHLRGQRLADVHVPRVVAALGASAARGSAVSVLDLSCNYIHDDGMRQIVTALAEGAGDSITELFLSDNRISALSGAWIAIAVQRCRKLRTLHIGDNRLGDDGIQHLAKALSINHELKTLDVTCNKIGAIGVKHIAEAFKDNSSLTSLDLSRNLLGDVGAGIIFMALMVNCSLTTLGLAAVGIGPGGATRMGTFLKDSMALTSLNLASNRIGDEGARKLAQVLVRNRSLTSLNLCSNGISDRGGGCLALAVDGGNGTLTSLGYHGNLIGRRLGALQLDAALDRTRVMAALGEAALSPTEIGLRARARSLVQPQRKQREPGRAQAPDRSIASTARGVSRRGRRRKKPSRATSRP